MTGIRPEDRILVTGASGVLGVALVAELRSHGYRSVAAVSSQDYDLRRPAAASRLFHQARPEAVFHLAARVYGIGGNADHRAATFLDNIRINVNVLDAAHRWGVKKVVAMGSVAMYSDHVPLPMREEDVWLGPPHHSEAPYAHAKRAMLAQLEAYHEEVGLDFALPLATNLFGPNDRFNERTGHVVPSLISKIHRAVQSQGDLHVWGTGSAQRDFLYSADAARALRLIGERYSGPINVASGETLTVRRLVEALVQIAGFSGTVLWDAAMPDGQRLRQYDTGKLRTIGFRPKYDLWAGLEATYAWYAQHHVGARR